MPDEPRPADDAPEDPTQARLEQMDEALRKARAEAALPEPPTEEEIHARLAAVAPRFEATRRGIKRHTERTDVPSDDQGTAVAIAVAYQLVGSVLGGCLLGWVIDRTSGTKIAWAIGTLVGAVAGMVSVILLVLRLPTGRGKQR